VDSMNILYLVTALICVVASASFSSSETAFKCAFDSRGDCRQNRIRAESMGNTAGKPGICTDG